MYTVMQKVPFCASHHALGAYILVLYNIKFSKFGQPLRHLLTNNKDGISISLVMFILGREIASIIC